RTGGDGSYGAESRVPQVGRGAASIRLDVPAPGLVAVERCDLLGFEIVRKPPAAEFASDAGLLVAAPWRFRECGLRAVDPDDTGAKGFGDAFTARLVLGHDRGGKAEATVVCHADGVRFGGERFDADDRSEDFLAPDEVV